MNIARAAAYALPFRNPTRLRGFAKVWLLAPVPLLGQLWAMGYANLALRRLLKGHGDDALPAVTVDRHLAFRGVAVMALALIVNVVVALLCAPLFFLEAPPEPDATAASIPAPALVQALAGPSELLVTVIAAVVTAVVLTRYALTNSLTAALNPLAAWTHLRAEPAIWIAAATVGFLLVNGVQALVWLLPLPGGWADAAFVASTYAWALGQMMAVHLSAQAFAWSHRTSAKRAASVGYRM